MKPSKVREMGTEELRAKERELQEQLFRLRVQQSIGQLENAIKLRETRRDIARRHGAFTVEVNPDATEASAAVDAVLRGGAEVVLPALDV